MSINLSQAVRLSLPTKKQTAEGIFAVVTAFVAGFGWAWLHSADPFSKAAVVAAGTGGVAAVIALARGLVTNI